MEELLARHRAFWERGRASAPLVGRIPTRTWGPRPYPLRDGRVAVDPTPLRPEDVDVDQLVGAGLPLEAPLFGDLIRPLNYRYPQAWMEALAGCPITVSAYGCVAKPAGGEPDRAAEWAAVMDRVLRRATDVAAGLLPVRQLHLRGLIDMLAAWLGEERLCMATADDPELLARLGERFAPMYLEAARRGLALRPRWRGGYVSMWNLYAPEPILDYQIDASSLFSARAYREHFLAHDRRVLGAFPHTVTHLHACGLRLLDALLDAPEFRAFQINLDRETGAWDRTGLLRACRRMQDAGRGIILHGELTEAERAAITGELAPEGLALCYWNP